jgi:integrase
MDGLVNYLDTPAAEFGALALQTVREGFIAENLTRKYVNRLTGYIVRMFRWAGAQELVDASVFTRLTAVEGLRVGFCTARENTVRQPVEESEILEVLPYLSKPVATALQVLFLTGARPSELLNLCPTDIDRSRPEVWIATLDKHKNSHRGKSRSLIFGPKAIQLLSPFLLRPSDKPLFSPAEAMEEMRARRSAERQTPVCCGNVAGSNVKDHPKIAPGESYKPTAFNRAIRAGIEKANAERRKQAGPENDPPLLRNFFPYLCRHAAATRIRGIAGLDAAASVLGHANASTTAEHYAKLSLETAISVMTRIG